MARLPDRIEPAPAAAPLHGGRRRAAGGGGHHCKRLLMAPEANDENPAAVDETDFWLSQPWITQDIAEVEADIAAGRTVSEEEIRTMDDDGE